MCVSVAGKLSHLLIRAETECVLNSAEIKPAQCCIKLVFHLTNGKLFASDNIQCEFFF